VTSIDWRRAINYGVCWGVAVTALESLDLPLGSMTGKELLVFAMNSWPHFVLAGILLAAVTMRLAASPVNALLVTWTLLLFPLLSTEISRISYLISAQVLQSRVKWVTDSDFAYLHSFWTSLFCGTLFVVAYRLSVRAERTRRVLARAEIARHQAESLLAESQLQALRGYVDPAFLLQVMHEVQRRYRNDPADADRLLDRLVGFLRAAMPGIRTGTSTLAAEAQLAVHYSMVARELDGSRPLIRLETSGHVPDLPFPALLMVPVLDQLAEASGGLHLDLHVSEHHGHCQLNVHAAGLTDSEWLSPELGYRLQVGLRALFGADWTLKLSAGPRVPAFALTLPVAQEFPISSTANREVSYG
jgi:hypothetical protein